MIPVCYHNAKSIGKWGVKHLIRNIRKLKKLTQEQLARDLGVRLMNVSIDALLGNEPARTASTIPSASNVFPLKTKKVPLLGDIACGEPIFANEEYGSFISTTDDLDVDFCLRAVGDSMIGARIYDGDIVFVRKQSSVDNGEIAAVLIDDEATLKRVYYYPDKNKLVLSPENPKYEPFVYIGEELSEVRILGKAVAFQSVIR